MLRGPHRRGLRVLVPLMLNPFSPVQLERIDIKVSLKFEANFGEIREVLRTNEVQVPTLKAN